MSVSSPDASTSPTKVSKTSDDGAFVFSYYDAVKKYTERVRAVNVCQSMGEDIKSLIMRGEFESKGRSWFPKSFLQLEGMEVQSLEGLSKPVYTYHDIMYDEGTGKEKCGYSVLFVSADEEENGLTKDLFAVFFNKCLFSNMVDDSFHYPVKVNGKTVQCRANCKEALFKIMSSFHAENPGDVLEQIYAAKTVPDLKKASRAAKGFNKESWDKVSKAEMLKIILCSCQSRNENTFEMIKHFVTLALDLSLNYGTKGEGLDICIFEAPDFEDNVWGCGLNREKAFELVLEILKSKRGHEVSSMFENILDDSADVSLKNVFNDRAKNWLGECLTAVARMFEEAWKSFKSRVWLYDAEKNVKELIRVTDMHMIRFGRLGGIGRDGSVDGCEFLKSLVAVVQPIWKTLIGLEDNYGIEFESLSEIARLYGECLKCVSFVAGFGKSMSGSSTIVDTTSVFNNWQKLDLAASILELMQKDPSVFSALDAKGAYAKFCETSTALRELATELKDIEVNVLGGGAAVAAAGGDGCGVGVGVGVGGA
jgi:hypothetical protein